MTDELVLGQALLLNYFQECFTPITDDGLLLLFPFRISSAYPMAATGFCTAPQQSRGAIGVTPSASHQRDVIATKIRPPRTA